MQMNRRQRLTAKVFLTVKGFWQRMTIGARVMVVHGGDYRTVGTAARRCGRPRPAAGDARHAGTGRGGRGTMARPTPRPTR